MPHNLAFKNKFAMQQYHDMPGTPFRMLSDEAKQISHMLDWNLANAQDIHVAYKFGVRWMESA